MPSAALEHGRSFKPRGRDLRACSGAGTRRQTSCHQRHRRGKLRALCPCQVAPAISLCWRARLSTGGRKEPPPAFQRRMWRYLDPLAAAAEKEKGSSSAPCCILRCPFSLPAAPDRGLLIPPISRNRREPMGVVFSLRTDTLPDFAAGRPSPGRIERSSHEAPCLTLRSFLAASAFLRALSRHAGSRRSVQIGPG